MNRWFEFLKSETVYDMIVDHADCLHEGVTDGRPDKFESSFNQIFAQGIGLSSTGGNIGYLFPWQAGLSALTGCEPLRWPRANQGHSGSVRGEWPEHR